MAETDEERKENRRIDLLYKNLEHTSNAYSLAEGVFPFWEAAFALIVGQFFVAYFDPAVCIYQQKWLAVLGCIVSFIWFILISLSLQNSLGMSEKLKFLEKELFDEIEHNEKKQDCPREPIRFASPWGYKKEDWTLIDIIIGKKKDERLKDALIKAPISTWFYRRILPLIMLIVWLWFLFKISLICFSVISFSILFMPIVFIIARLRTKNSGNSGGGINP